MKTFYTYQILRQIDSLKSSEALRNVALFFSEKWPDLDEKLISASSFFENSGRNFNFNSFFPGVKISDIATLNAFYLLPVNQPLVYDEVRDSILSSNLPRSFFAAISGYNDSKISYEFPHASFSGLDLNVSTEVDSFYQLSYSFLDYFKFFNDWKKLPLKISLFTILTQNLSSIPVKNKNILLSNKTFNKVLSGNSGRVLTDVKFSESLLDKYISRLTLFKVDFIDRWRGYNPEFGYRFSLVFLLFPLFLIFACIV
jgi:hypothetical protein